MEKLFSRISRMFLVTFLSSAATLACATSGYAAAEDAAPDVGNFDVYGMLFKVMGYLLLIVALFYVLIRFIAKKNRQYTTGRAIKNWGGVALGQNKSVQVVEIGHSLFVLGVGENVQLISQITDPEEVQHIRDHMQISQTVDLQSFESVGKWFQSLRKPKQTEEELPASFQQLFADKMKRVSSKGSRVEDLLDDENREDRLNDTK